MNDITIHMRKNDGLEIFFFFHIQEILSHSREWGSISMRLPDDPGGFKCMQVYDFHLKVSEAVGVVMEQHEILDQYLPSGKVSTRSIQRFKRYPFLKTLTKNFSIKFHQSP